MDARGTEGLIDTMGSLTTCRIAPLAAQVDISNAMVAAIDTPTESRFHILIGRAQYKLWDTPVLI